MTMLTMFGGNSRQPGDFGWDPMGLMSPANEERMKMRELQHGRLADDRDWRHDPRLLRDEHWRVRRRELMTGN